MPGPQAQDIEAALLKARVKAKLLGEAERVHVGRFELTRRCGEGGEGVVYEAYDPSLDRRVALKCLHAHQVMQGASLQREFRAAARLVHPNLALLYELFCVGGRWFHSMELLAGVSFLAHVRAGGCVDEQRLRDALGQLLRGLAVIHAAGKVHRDLKPNNVLVEPDGRVVIVDYGLMVERPTAAVATSGRGLFGHAGTFGYMAPEQVRRGTVQAAADLYAVGVMLFEALTGERPEALHARHAVPAAMPRQALRPSRYVTGVPPDLDLLCSQLLAEEPTQRPSASEVITRLAVGTASVGALDGVVSVPLLPEGFVGRAAELRALHAAYVRARDGRATLALVHGESGMGKTALLAQFRRELSSLAQPPLLWAGQCYERESTPFKLFDSVIEQLVDYLAEQPEANLRGHLPREIEAAAQIFPAFLRLAALRLEQQPAAPKDRPEQRKRAFSAVRALFRRLRADAPVVLCMDDLQWGDVDSIRLLQELLSAPEAPALLLVAAYRRSETASSPLLREALGKGALYRLDCEVVEVPVDALDMAAARELMGQTQAARGTPEAFERQLRAAAGIPFLLCELAQQRALPNEQAEPALTLESVVQRHKARCSAAAQTLLDVLCIAGRPLEMSLALRAGAVSSDGWKAASELCATRLARWRDTHGERCLEPYHDLIRRAVLAQADRHQVRQVHAAIVRDMESLAMDEPTLRVHHLIAAGEPLRAGEVAITAAQRAVQKLAWESAAELLGLALELLPPSHAQALTLHAQHGEALALAGRHRAAAAAHQRAAALAPASDAAVHLRSAAQQLMRAGEAQQATELLQRLLRGTGLRYPHSEARAIAIYLVGSVRRALREVPKPSLLRERPAAEAQRLATLATVYAELWLADPVRSLAIHTWFFEEACRTRDHYRLQALTWEISQLAVVRGPSALPRLAQLQAEIDLQAAHGASYDRAVAQLARAMCLIHAERRPADAEPLIDEADRILSEECTGTHFERCWLLLMRDHVYEMRGDFSALGEAVLPYERSECEDGYTLQRLLTAVPLVRLAYDQPGEALRFLQTRWQRSRRRATLADFIALMRLSDVHLYQGEALAAFQSLDRAWAWLRMCGLFRSAPMREMAEFYRARSAAALYRESGHPRWRKQARFREWRVFERAYPETRGLTCLIEASLARTEGRHSACRALLQEAKADFKCCQNDTAYWAAEYRLAQLDEAPATLGQAREWMRSRGIRQPERWVTLFMP